MRLLFISGTTEGGSGRSQRELASRLAGRGHEIFFLVDDGRPARMTRWLYGHLSDLAVRLESTAGAGFASWLERRPGRWCTPRSIGGIEHMTAVVPQNALARFLDDLRPDVVVGNSLERLAWRRIHRLCSSSGIATMLYVRETDSLEHLRHGEVPDVLVANAESLQAALIERGFACAFVPSVVDVDVTRTRSTRRVVLAINPVESRGADIVWKVAAAAPEIPFVVQESWPLGPRALAAVEAQADRLSNVELRRSRPPGQELYGDARVLLVPYRVDNRPRVVVEAQANGIPVLAADVPALREAVGVGGEIVPIGDIDAWVGALRRLWGDEERYQELVAAARAHGARPAIDPDTVTASFVTVLGDAVRGRPPQPAEPDR